MKRIEMFLAGLVLFLVSPLGAQVTIPDPLPAFEFTYSPTNPTTQDEVSLQVSCQWPNNCPPDSMDVSVNGTAIVISLLLPGAVDGNEPNCSPIQTAYAINTSVGPLAVGSYSVAVRVVSFTDATDTTNVGAFTVGIPAGGGPSVPVGVGPGVCVVLLQDWPDLSLRAGQAGMVVCCDSQDCSGRLLVSWFLNTTGAGTSDDCDDTTPRAMPPASATWVDPSRVALGICFNECGILGQNDEGCYTLETDEGLTYILVADSWLPDFLGQDADFNVGDRVRVQGLVNIRRPEGAFFACTERDGDIFNPVITPCAPASGNGNGGATPCPNDSMTIGFGTKGIRVFRDPDCSTETRTFSGCVNAAVQTNFRARLSLSITPLASVGGTWTGTIAPEIIPAGETTVTVCVTATDLNLAAIPAGQDTQVATVSILGVPEPE